ncbi:MAG: protoheme farnesyltransferase [Actinomycetia bacterium]|nr:protoheme farnesyltransferase [Actinomycetes bacterium]
MLHPTALETPARRLSATVGTYVRLCKPRVVELLLVTALPPMVLAARGFPAWHLVFAVLIGGALAAGGANAINCWIERDRDVLMKRTHHRPLPAGDMEPTAALVFGIALNVVAFALLASLANVLSAVLTLTATLFYVFVYTIWLKPRSVQNIVIGGAAGAVPALVGWAAVTGRVSAPAWVLFLVVFAWTPAHFWALALKYRDDYAAAGIPMLPVVKGVPATTRAIAQYAVLTVAITLMLGLVTTVGWIYVAVASVAGAAFIFGAFRLVRDADPKRAIRFFGLSNVYLMLVFVAVAVDTLVFR